MVDVRRDIYLVRVDGYIAALKPYKQKMFSYAKQSEFLEFVQGLIEDFPQFRLRCINNQGVVEDARRRIKADKALQLAAQKINGGNNGK